MATLWGERNELKLIPNIWIKKAVKVEHREWTLHSWIRLHNKMTPIRMWSAAKSKTQSAERPNIKNGQSTSPTWPKTSCLVLKIRIKLQPVDSKRNSKRKHKSKLADTTFCKRIWVKPLMSIVILFRFTVLFVFMNSKCCQCWRIKNKKATVSCPILNSIFPIASMAEMEEVFYQKEKASIKITWNSCHKIQVKWIILCNQIISAQDILHSIKAKTSIQFWSTIHQIINSWKFHKFWKRKR